MSNNDFISSSLTLAGLAMSACTLRSSNLGCSFGIHGSNLNSFSDCTVALTVSSSVIRALAAPVSLAGIFAAVANGVSLSSATLNSRCLAIDITSVGNSIPVRGACSSALERCFNVCSNAFPSQRVRLVRGFASAAYAGYCCTRSIVRLVRRGGPKGCT